MDMTGVHVVPATTEAVWHALHDPEMLKCCIPGCASIEPDGENAYRMALTANVGPVSARFAGKVKIADGEAPRAYTIRFEGTGGPAGFVNGEASVILTPGDAGSTTLSYAARAQVGGKLAQIGSRLDRRRGAQAHRRIFRAVRRDHASCRRGSGARLGSSATTDTVCRDCGDRRCGNGGLLLVRRS